MTSMKDYVDEMMDDIAESNGSDENEPSFQESFEAGVCPFCHSEEFIILIKKEPQGKSFYHTCPFCGNSWVLSFDPETDEIIASEIDLSEFLPDNLD